ncbi:MAG: hypothetical protein NC231_07905 [Bacillus sp. (in: Bacteria)]|nr:hypothetical protein [Bacillus sp. (in: firmicutes)]MCM1427347.1 hypothetical protein [Eubacterium sp.]
MYFISILAIIFVTVLMGCSSGSFSLVYFIDLPSVLMILLICIPILISAGLFKDFNNAFRIALSKKRESSLIAIRRALEAVTLTIRTLLSSGLFLLAFSLLMILRRLDDLSALGPVLSVALITWAYTLIITLLLLPIKSILNVHMIEFMQEENADAVGREFTEKETPEKETE